jgi:hypothetical protein
MRKSIEKFKLEPHNVQQLKIPEHSKILCIQAEGDYAYVYIETTSGPTKDRFINTYSITSKFPRNPGEYIGSCKFDDGTVLHYYEKTY